SGRRKLKIRSPLSSCDALDRAEAAEEQTAATEIPCLSRTLRIFLASSILGSAITMLLIQTCLHFLTDGTDTPLLPSLLPVLYISTTHFFLRPHTERRILLPAPL